MDNRKKKGIITYCNTLMQTPFKKKNGTTNDGFQQYITNFLLHVAYTKTPKVLLTLDRRYSRRDRRPSRAVDWG